MAKEAKKKKKMSMVTCVISSVALATGAMLVMPKVIEYLSNNIVVDNKPKKEDDDWGPEIVKKDKKQGE